MHITTVINKAGEEFRGIILKDRPIEGWIELGGVFEPGDRLRLRLNTIISIMTEGERHGGDKDHLNTLRRYMRDGRKYGWDGLTADTPYQEWEEAWLSLR